MLNALYQNSLETMEYLNSVLPKGSTVLWSGVVDGRILYGGMHDKIHPLGEMFGNVRYRDLYDYLNCLEISPCYGWLTSDKNLREASSARAREQTMALKTLLRDYPDEHWLNINNLFYEFDMVQLVGEWLDNGGKAISDVIDPTDGFHPSQAGMALQAKYMWKLLLEGKDDVIGKRNPFNDEIMIRFVQADGDPNE